MRIFAILLLLTGVGVGSALGVREWSQTHPILPGVSGCKTIKQYRAKEYCYHNRVLAMLESKSPKEVAHAIAHKAKSDSSTRAFCHDALHQVGERAGKQAARERIKDPPIINEIEDNCLQGYSHGVMIGMFSVYSANQLFKATGSLCAPRGAFTTPLDCLHAIGHVLLRKRESVSRSVQDCVELNYDALVADPMIGSLRKNSPTTWKRYVQEECNKGVYMEHAFRILKKGKIKDPIVRALQTCAEVTYGRFTCVEYVPMSANLLGGTVEDGIRVCASFDGKERKMCAFGAGIVAADATACGYLEVKKYVDTCMLAKGLSNGEIDMTQPLPNLT